MIYKHGLSKKIEMIGVLEMSLIFAKNIHLPMKITLGMVNGTYPSMTNS